MSGDGWRRLALALSGVVLAACVAAGAHLSPARAAACPWMNRAQSPDRRARELVAAMSLDDKITLVHQSEYLDQYYGTAGYIPANPSLCIPALTLNDGGQGVGDAQSGTTAFQAPISQAATWDPATARAVGRAIGSEAWHKGIDVQLAPDVNIARVPLNGRNYEAFGEDPFLTGQTAVAVIDGIQSEHVIATVKHYAGNNQETNRMTISSDIGERALHEIYTPAFEAAVKQAHVGSVMCAYNKVNNIYSCQQPTLLGRILKGQFGFPGFVMSDWGATHSTVASAKAGLDQEMNISPGTYYGSALESAVHSGQVPMSRLDDMVRRITRSMFAVGVFDHPPAAEPAAFQANVETPADVQLARTASEEGTVLLKDAGGALPLTGHGQRIALIGEAAGPEGAELYYNGQGSAHVPEFGGKSDVVSPLQAIDETALSRSDAVTYSDGSSTADAVAAASTANVAIVFAHDAESEGVDRSSLALDNSGTCTLAGCTPGTTDQDALIQSVAQANRHTIVVLDTGGPVLMPWLARVQAVVEAWYPGQQDGNAIAPILFGDVDPSGKLPETFPRSQADLPTRTPQQYPGVGGQAVYSEGLFVGYRWYYAKRITPLFAFGFGLSYTSFGLRHLKVRAAKRATAATASFDVVNTGHRAGAEVAELYVASPRATGEPPKQLEGFAKVSLAPGRVRRLTIGLDSRSFAYWSVRSHAWRVAPGCYRILVGRSSRDVPLSGPVAVGGARCPGALARIPLAGAHDRNSRRP